MLEIFILKVENPSCLWGRVVCGADGSVETTEHYTTLQAQMNLFYQDVTKDPHQLKPTSLEEGQVYVVYWAVKKSWCRAVVRSVITDPTCCRAFCFLVDHGEMIVVSLDKIRVSSQKFLQLPFWVRRFHLARIQPITLRVSVLTEKVELEPSRQWDYSATLYLHNLLRASTQTEAVLHELESDSTSIELYLTISNIKICVNDDLVANRFACYSSSGLDACDRFPLMLSPSILTQTASKCSDKQMEENQHSPSEHGGSSESPGASEAGDWLTTPSLSQSQIPELVSCEEGSRSEDTKEPMFFNNQTKHGPKASGAESDSSEETDFSLASALTKSLGLFRFLKFLNPGRGNQLEDKEQSQEGDVRPEARCRDDDAGSPQVEQNDDLNNRQPETTELSETGTEQEQDAASIVSETNLQSKTGDVSRSILVGSPGHVEASDLSTSVQCGVRCEEDRVCSRLLEWLNPEPFNSDPDAGDEVVSLDDPWVKGILVHSTLSMEPCNTLEDAPITNSLHQVLVQKNYRTLSPADCYSWPAIARGCNTFVISQNADQPLGYLIPLLTHIFLNSLLLSHLSSSGPIAVLLCPGWEKAQMIYNLLEESKVSQTLHPIIVLVGIGKDEAKAVKFPKNCLLLVTTPFTLVRLLSCHCFLFLRLYHLVLDEADQLFTFAPDEMATILQHFQKVTSSEEKTSCPRQLVAVAKRWTSPMEDLISNHMPDPSIVITVPEEAALYGNIQQVILMTVESNKISALLGVLDFSPEVGQKTLIVANSAEEVEDVFKAVGNKSAFCLKIHKGLLDQLDFVIQQWRKNIGPGTHVILVSTSECLKSLGIRDAACVVHYGFPPSPKVFGYRLFCMAENFRNLPKQDQTDGGSPVSRSVLLISERNARHVVGVLRYLERTDAPLPPVLFSFAEGVHVAREDQKTDRPFCSYLKSFGFCRDRSVCPDRHRINPQSDQSALPSSGVIEVLPLYIKTASVFYGRLVRQNDKEFDKMASEMMSYYADKKPGAKELLEGALYAVQEDEIFHRVKILALPDHGQSIFYKVLVQFIDIGKESDVKSHQILELPPQFHSLPHQAVEMVVCRVKPADAEIEWHPKVTRAISQKIRGLQHRARAVLCLGNTVFVDPMVRVTQMPGTKTFINEYNVQTEILKTGMGVSNPEHLDFFRAAVQENSSKDGEEKEQRGDHASSDEDRRGICESNPAASMNLHENGEPDGDEQVVSRDETVCNDLSKSLYPQVVWYQTCDSVIITVKLMNPEGQRCNFYTDRVVYSGSVNGRSYRADLELHQNIEADICHWEMKSNQPVLKLVKQQQGHWERLIRSKNIFVSYDMDHVDDDEEKSSSCVFVENTGEDCCYLNSESGSDSD
ncbi:putative ATP-dependent RNA helicase TDRD12 isoform X1 [Gambusia affinis]|uniref:putative ATP-dependent RNA helicase TDRD12 isoform X1 n=1 Tax=Gambusia affinis TaxID=33528 RepID=UPI001CDBB380|nr:putative ATP-dependent RNA helicase TDRD12 isoform X1 [Gambusia affinis]XP_043979979.1 putative ATP-dependent RNA helicase TDRD12 isoform X1 [Gambusia affinis]